MKTTVFEEMAREAEQLRERIRGLTSVVAGLEREREIARAENAALWQVIDADRRLLAIVGGTRCKVAAQPPGETETDNV